MIYMDNAATEFVANDNPTGMNPNTKYAHKSNEFLKKSYDHMKELLGVHSGMIIFGGQNASQLIDLLYWKCRDNDIHFDASVYEHDCIYNKLDGYGYFIDDEQAKDYIDGLAENGYQDVVCRMLVNNITGEIFNNKPLGQYCREHNQFFLMDCTSAIGHVELPNDLEKWCDCVIMSGHKFGGGYMGCMWISERLCEALNVHSAFDLASGTPNVKGIDEFVRAFELANKDMSNKMPLYMAQILSLQDGFERYNIEYHMVFGKNRKTSAINAIRLPGINADALQQYLASKQIYIGRGASACDSNSDDFRVLQAYGLTKREASEVIRVSFSQWNSKEDIEELVKAICEFKEKYCQ